MPNEIPRDECRRSRFEAERKLILQLRHGRGLTEHITLSGGVWRDAWVQRTLVESANTVEALIGRIDALRSALLEISEHATEADVVRAALWALDNDDEAGRGDDAGRN